MQGAGDKAVDNIVEEFNVNTEATELVKADGRGRLFRIRDLFKNVEAYILDTPEARALACMPHIVSSSFYTLNMRLAWKASELILDMLRSSSSTPLYMHVLRAAPGYMMHEALRRRGAILREAFIRPRYVTYAERDHTLRRIEVGEKDLSSMPSKSNIVLIKPDTEATGYTSIAVLKEAVREALERDSRIAEIILYGFISAEALDNISTFAGENRIERVRAVALLDIAALASNDYDMVLYGPDAELAFRGVYRRLGAIVDRDTLAGCARMYMPGMDQPGDWSARQDILFDGNRFVRNDVRRHLAESLDRAVKLLRICGSHPWFGEEQRRAFKLNLMALTAALSRL